MGCSPGGWHAAPGDPSPEDCEAFDEELRHVQAGADEAKTEAVAARSASWRAWVDQALAGGASQGHRYVKGLLRWGDGSTSVVGKPASTSSRGGPQRAVDQLSDEWWGAVALREDGGDEWGPWLMRELDTLPRLPPLSGDDVLHAS